MKKVLILSLLISFTFIQCTKKMTDKTNKKIDMNDISWRSKAPKPSGAKIVQLGDYQSFDMENGLKVILVENHKRPIASFQLTLNHEQIFQGDQVGFVSMAGDLISKGTSKRSKSELDNAIDFIGANITTNSTGIYAGTLKKHVPELLDIMSEMLLDASFPQEEFEKSKKQALSGLAMSLSNADAMMNNVGDFVRYGKGHPYGEIQTAKSTEKIDIASCKSYYKTYFRPNNAYLIMVGDITIEEAKVLSEKYFSSWERAEIPSVSYPSPMGPSGNNVVMVDKENAVQSVINITYPIDLKPGSSDIIKTRVMNAILGGGVFSGRLMQNLREDKAYTYGARSRTVADPLVGYFNAYANVRNEVTDSSVTQFLYELKRIKSEKVAAKDLQLVKNAMTGGFARSLESPQTIARFARNTFKYNLPKDYYRNYLKKLEAVTITDVYDMAQKYIKPNNANIIIVGNKDDVAKKLEKFDADKKIDFYNAYGEKI